MQSKLQKLKNAALMFCSSALDDDKSLEEDFPTAIVLTQN